MTAIFSLFFDYKDTFHIMLPLPIIILMYINFMINFVKDSLREIKHVVWPTKAETRKYFLVVLSVLVIFGIYLFIFSNIFSYVMFFLKDALANIL